jgi:hypothetical protein
VSHWALAVGGHPAGVLCAVQLVGWFVRTASKGWVVQAWTGIAASKAAGAASGALVMSSSAACPAPAASHHSHGCRCIQLVRWAQLLYPVKHNSMPSSLDPPLVHDLRSTQQKKVCSIVYVFAIHCMYSAYLANERHGAPSVHCVAVHTFMLTHRLSRLLSTYSLRDHGVLFLVFPRHPVELDHSSTPTGLE